MPKAKVEPYKPEEGEPWTSITEEELEAKGFKLNEVNIVHDVKEHLPEFYNPVYKDLLIKKSIVENTWMIYLAVGYVDPSTKVDLLGYRFLRAVQYMYQIDNMFHGFTDRWLGYI